MVQERYNFLLGKGCNYIKIDSSSKLMMMMMMGRGGNTEQEETQLEKAGSKKDKGRLFITSQLS